MKIARETFAGRRRAPDMFGLERAALYPIAGAWTAAGMFLTLLHMRFGLAWGACLLLTSIPAAATTAGALFLIQGRPPGYLADWLEQSVLGGRHYDLPRRRVMHPIHDPRPRT